MTAAGTFDRLRQADSEDEFEALERELGARWVCQSLAEVATAFGVHEATVRTWRMEGLPGTEGLWHLPTIIQWRIAKAERRSGVPEDESERASRRKSAAIKASRDEIKLQLETGKLVERDAVEAKLLSMFSVIRARLQALPGEIAASVPAEVRGQVMEESSAKVIQALKELAKRAD